MSSRSHRDDQMEAIVDQHGIHGALHALVETCYRRASEIEDEDQDRPGRQPEHLREVARQLTYLEELASRLDL